MKKLKCIVTGNWVYANEATLAKMVAAGTAKPTSNPEVYTYTSRQGLTLLAANGGDLDKAKAAASARVPGKVRCIVTGELMVVSKERMTKLAAAHGGDEEKVHATYVSRVAAKLRESLSPKDKLFPTLSQEERENIDAQIRALADENRLPRASVPKGQGVKRTPKKVVVVLPPSASATASTSADPATTTTTDAPTSETPTTGDASPEVTGEIAPTVEVTSGDSVPPAETGDPAPKEKLSKRERKALAKLEAAGATAE